MSLNSALNVAKSGLGATASRADIVSRNIVNADTKGYVRKTEQSITRLDGGVSIQRIDRQVDNMLNGLDRANISKLAAQGQVVDGMTAYTDVLGQPSDEMSPAAYLSRFNTDMATLSLDPDSSAAQQAAVSSAGGLIDNLIRLTDVLAEVSSEVEATIRLDVSDVNSALNTIARLNRDIAMSGDGSLTASTQRDDLDRALDQLAGFMDIQIRTDSNGLTNVYTGGGTELVVGTTAMPVKYNLGVGTLTAGGIDITPGAGSRGFSGGSLSGLFTMRNEVIPAWSADLDTIAGGLVEGFGRVAELSPGSGIGLFTDAGGSYDPANHQGIAHRLRLNALVDPEQGGNVAILQTGGAPGVLPGDTDLIKAMISVMNQPVQVPVADGSAPAGLTSLVSSIVARQQSERADVETEASRLGAAAKTITASRMNMQGVDVDTELSNLLAIEQSYAANAKIISSVSSMLDDLMAAV